MSKADEIIKIKELFDRGTITREEFLEQKKAILEQESDNGSKVKNIANKVLRGMGIAFGVIIVIALIFGKSDDTKPDVSTENSTSVETAKTENNDFSAEMPIRLSGKMEEDILGFPEIKCHVENIASANISAMQFYFIPYDVYGDEINSVLVNPKLDYTEMVSSNNSKEISWQILDKDVKSGDLYLYSIYFEDKTEWGNRNASKSDILKYAYKIEIK